MIAGRKRWRNPRNCAIQRPHELELLGREIRHLGHRLDGPFVEDARDVASENRSGRNKAGRRNRGDYQPFHDVLALLEGVMHPRQPDQHAVRCGLPDAIWAPPLRLLTCANSVVGVIRSLAAWAAL